MSGFACLFDRRGVPVDPCRIERLDDALTDYGTATTNVCTGAFGITVRHPQSVRARQCHGPITDDVSGLTVAVVGRFSLIDGIRPETSHGAGDPDQAGCARWVLDNWISDQWSWLDEIAGSFTVVVAEPETRRVTVLRDHLGDLKVYYRLTNRLLIVATEAGAILRDESVTAEPDEGSVARFLGFRFCHTDRSFFRGIRELAPAHRLQVTADDDGVEPYWRFRRATIDRPASEVATEFLDRLRQSMRRHLDGLATERIGLSLSGGLDSTAIAAVAPRGIRAYSWCFQATPDRRERDNIEAVSRHLGLPVRWIEGDDQVPLGGDFCSRFVHHSSPYINPFAGLKTRLYSAAREDGCRRMIVGDGGDVLYGARPYWLRDALRARQPWVWSALGRTVGGALKGDPFCRAALRRIAPVEGIGRVLRRTRKPAWLTAQAASLLPPDRLSPVLPHGLAAHRYDLSVGTRNIELESEERRLFCRCGIDRANPFWSWPLLEMVLALPAYWFHRDGWDKVLVRRTFDELLPAPVLTSDRVGLLGGFFLRGIREHRRELSELVIRHPRSDWQRYVKPDWLERHLWSADSICFGHTILWRTISYELWVRRVWDSDADVVFDPQGRRVQSR
jgi:asparagine synthase (glutamine-hydrolysing)